MAKVVIDANVLVSAAFGGFSRKAVEHAFAEHELFLSKTVLAELLGLDTLFKQSQRTRWHKLIKHVKSLSAVVDAKEVKICRDPKDDMYLGTCLSSGATFLVTEDHDLLSLTHSELAQAGLRKLRIVNPLQFLSDTLK